MSRITVNDKKEAEASEVDNVNENKEEEREKDIYALNKTYTEALSLFLEPGRSPPRRDKDYGKNPFQLLSTRFFNDLFSISDK